MNIAFFDLDDTLLAGDSDYEWGRFLVAEGVVDVDSYDHHNALFQGQYAAGNLDIRAFQRFVLAPLIEQPWATMAALRARFIETRVRLLVARHASALLDGHRERGDELVIITATNRFVTEPIAEHLGIDHLIATEPEIIDGAYTGEISGVPSYREGKIERAREWLTRQTQAFDQIYFYSDSHNDLPLLRWADHPVAVDPDPTLADAARTAGWPIISLRGDDPPDLSADRRPPTR